MHAIDEFPERFGPFVLLKLLGVGGMGSAYLAFHPESGGMLVVKRMHPELLSEPTIFKRFVHEAEVAAHVKHPNVAALVAMGAVEQEPFLATEFVFGIQITEIIERVEGSVIDQVPLGVGLHISLELLEGLSAIHEARHSDTGAPLGLIHRDVGARNVLVGFDGRVRLIDLGLGKSILADWHTAHQVVAGSPDYMAPEQAMGGEVDARADVYAASVTIWELLAGKKRIREETIAGRLRRAIEAEPEPLMVHREDVSKRLESVLKVAMSPEPETRTPTAQLMLRAMNDATKGKRADTEAVVSWLDVACATYIARQRRVLDEARALADTLDGPKVRPKTELFVQRPDFSMSAAYNFYNSDERSAHPADLNHLNNLNGPADIKRGGSTSVKGAFMKLATLPAVEAVASMLDPVKFRRASRRERAVFIGAGLAVLVLISSVTAVLVTPDPPDVSAVSLPPIKATKASAPKRPAVNTAPPISTPPPRLGEDSGDVEIPPPIESPPLRKRPPISPELRAKKRALLRRIRQLRKENFEIDWQRRLTKLSTRLSRTRSASSLEEIEWAIAKMEQGK